MDSVERWLNRIGFFCGAVAFVALPLFIIASIIVRQFGFSLSFAIEYSTYLLPVLGLYAGGYVLSKGGHVNTDLFKGFLGPKVWNWCILIGLILGLAYLVILGIECTKLAVESLRFGYRSMYGTRTLVGYPQLIVPFGIFLFAFQTVIEIIRQVKRVLIKEV